MPILAQHDSPSLYPDCLLFEPPQDEEQGRCWWVLRTKPKQEKALARQLSRLPIPFYLPLHEKLVVSSGRKFKSFCPLFPSYMFLFGNLEEKLQCWQTNRLVHVIEVRDSQRLTRELLQLKRLLDTGAPVTTESRLEAGIEVRIRNGIFKGLEGTITSRQGKTLLRVSVEFLHATITLQEGEVEPMDYEKLARRGNSRSAV